jgi:hypothetical protein
MILAILSTVTVLATLWTLATAIRDRRQWVRSRCVTAAEALIGVQAVVIESLRLVKHCLLIASVWTAVMGNPQPWLATTTALILGGTSLLTRYFRRQTQRRIQQDKRVSVLKAAQTASPIVDRPKP